ncbi:MAG: hypothetical protein PF482_03735 [Desulfobacteraceae bacterium]|jgi:hypothetical protein|nr:hypothetical protein [Desulfobacteraceae bacterium]
MNHNIIFTACISLWFMILPAGFNFGVANAADMSGDSMKSTHQTIPQNSESTLDATPGTDAGTSKNAALLYPDPILQQLGINPSDIIKNQLKFKNNRIHIEWMDHVHEALPGICREKKDAIIKIHTSLLFIKDRLDKAFFRAKINKQEYTTQLTGVMKWFQASNRSFLSIEEYNALFGISGQNDERLSANASDGKIDFPVNNPETTVEMIKKNFDDTTIKNISRFYHVQSQELRDMKKIYETEELREEDAKQIKNDMLMVERELAAAFISYCRDILSENQFKLLFGTSKNE